MAVRPVCIMLALMTALAAALLAAPAALAGVRTAVVTDAQDGWTTATGQPSTPDLLRTEVRYDTAGTLTVTADFAVDVRGLATDRAFAWSLRYTIGKPSETSTTTCVPIVTGAAQIAVFNGAPIRDRLAIAGTDGYLPYTVQFAYPPEVPGTRLTFTATSPALVGRDLRCLAFAVAARELGSDEDPGTVLDEVCELLVPRDHGRHRATWLVRGLPADAGHPADPAEAAAEADRPAPAERDPRVARPQLLPAQRGHVVADPGLHRPADDEVGRPRGDRLGPGPPDGAPATWQLRPGPIDADRGPQAPAGRHLHRPRAVLRRRVAQAEPAGREVDAHRLRLRAAPLGAGRATWHSPRHSWRGPRQLAQPAPGRTAPAAGTAGRRRAAVEHDALPADVRRRRRGGEEGDPSATSRRRGIRHGGKSGYPPGSRGRVLRLLVSAARVCADDLELLVHVDG